MHRDRSVAVPGWRRIRSFDWSLLLGALAAIGFGTAMIYSATLRGEPVDTWWQDLVFRQLFFAGVGVAVLLILTVTEYHALAAFWVPVYVVTIALLAAVLGVGEQTFGSMRSFDAGPMSLQPSEISKWSMILVLAAYMARYDIRRTKHLVSTLAMTALAMFLVLQQPDLSTTVMLGTIWLGMAFVAGLRLPQLAGLSLLGAPMIGVLLATGGIKTYQLQRIVAWLDPTIDPGGLGFQNLHTLIAVGNGGVLGIGFARGLQSQGGWLPLMHTDNIFALVAEELGFLGGVLLLALLLFITLRILRAARTAQDRLGALLCSGVAIYFLAQIMVNVGVVLQLLPVTGVSLPLISYGGSSLVAAMGALGLVQSVLVQRRPLDFG